MSLLLDTHVWIWSQESPEQLGAKAVAKLLAPVNSLYICTISTLEIARLAAHGAISMEGSLKRWIARSLESLQAQTVEITHEIALAAYDLPASFHKDPADRLLAAAAQPLDMELMTADERLLSYHFIQTVDART